MPYAGIRNMADTHVSTGLTPVPRTPRGQSVRHRARWQGTWIWCHCHINCNHV